MCDSLIIFKSERRDTRLFDFMRIIGQRGLASNGTEKIPKRAKKRPVNLQLNRRIAVGGAVVSYGDRCRKYIHDMKSGTARSDLLQRHTC